MYAKSQGIYQYVTTHFEIDSEADSKTRKHFYEVGLAISSSVGPELKHLVNLDTMDEAYTCPLAMMHCLEEELKLSNHTS